MDENRKRLLTVVEAAAALSVTPSCIRRWILLRRNIGYCKVGRAIRIPREEVEKLIERGFVPAREVSRAR